MNIDLTGRVALVTGAGRGIGEAIARTFAAVGAHTVLADRNADSARRVAEEIGGTAVELDIAQESMVTDVIARIEAQQGPIDILVNCAGVLQNTDPPERLSMSTWDRIVNVHQRGTYMMCAQVGLRMAGRRRGCIVNIASVAGMRSAPLHAYSPAKAAIISMTECLAAEWGPSGVRVNAVSPGFVSTPGVERGFESGMLDPKRMAASTALGRLVKPDEIAAGVLFLASDMASAITGVTLAVDAGFLVATPWAPYGRPGRAEVTG